MFLEHITVSIIHLNSASRISEMRCHMACCSLKMTKAHNNGRMAFEFGRHLNDFVFRLVLFCSVNLINIIIDFIDHLYSGFK
uniref:Uncharacterized protein n=1 Tax=Lepeophtheirus salmonis TaxID=72036 RepID=A0A0K2V186_LEPSM